MREPIDEIIEKVMETKLWAVTGTFHGSWVEAKTEGEARRIFHQYWKGESIIHIKTLPWSAVL